MDTEQIINKLSNIFTLCGEHIHFEDVDIAYDEDNGFFVRGK